MATTTPIDVEKYLLEGLEPLPETKKRLPTKPSLDEALTNYYNKTAPPGSRQLAPGETPLPVSTEIEGPPAPGIMSRLPSLPSFGGGAVPAAADRSIAGVASPLATTPIAPITKGPSVTPAEPTFPTEPLAAGKVPGATAATPTPAISTAEKPSGWYNTLQKHATFVRDVAEAGGTVLADIGAGAFGAATAISDVLNAHMARIARGGGPVERSSAVGAPDPLSPTFYGDILKRMEERVKSIQYEPKSDIAKNARKATGFVSGVIHDISSIAGWAGKQLGATEDQAKALTFAAELYVFYKLDRGIRDAAPELRSKISAFKERFTKSPTDAAAAADDLATAASKNPQLDRALDEARGKFRDEADATGATRPRGPEPEGPAPGGATVDFTPEELGRYTDALNKATTDFRASRPEGFTIDELRTHLDQTVPKPQGTPRPAEPTPAAARPTEPVAPTPEPTRVTPTGDIALNEDLRNYVDGQLAAGMPVDQIVRNVRPSVRGDISDAQIREAVRTQTRPGPEPAEPPIGRTPRVPTRQEIVNNALGIIRDSSSSPAEISQVLSIIKREAHLESPEDIIGGLNKLGIDNATIDNLFPEFREARERIRSTPEPTRPTRPTEPRVVTDFDILPPEAAATVAPETVPAPVSPETPAVAATPTIRLYRTDIPAERRPAATDPSQSHVASRHLNYIRDWRDANAPGADIYYIDVPFDPSNPMTPEPPESITPQQRSQLKLLPEEAAAIPSETIAPPAARARELYESANAMGVTDKQYRERLAELKGIAREGLRPNQSARANLEKLGFTPEEIPIVDKQLKGIRAKAPAKPAIQTAATEAALETMPAGTEVEIPRPAEPVVDSSPAIEKPKRTRRVVKAPTLEAVVEAAPTVTAEAPAGEVRYYGVRGVNMLQDFVGSVPELYGGTTLPRAPIQVRANVGAKLDAVFIDTSGLNTRTTLADIDVQQERGRMTDETADALRNNLRRQAELSGKLLEEAHQFTGQELLQEATRIAAETGIDLYVKKGKNYELVPKDVVRTDARLNRGDDLEPTPISAENAGAYVENKTSDIGPDAVRGILDAIERGIDVTERLPAELVPHYKQMREAERAGIDTSERRAFIDILTDLNTMLGEEGSIGGSFNRAQRMAAQRLQADMRKAGKAAREFLFGARPEDVAMFESYLETINNPVPVNSTNPRNMRFDPENIIPGDRIVKQRNVSKALSLDAVPLWQSEVRGIQNARDIPAGGTPWDLKLPIRQHKAAGTEFIYYAYRTAQKNLNAELTTLGNDMTELGRGFSSKSLENIGANGYQRQGPDGQRILTYNKVTPQPLTTAERRLQSAIDGMYRVTEIRLNEGRIATGREPLDHVDNYQTFARTIGLLGRLGIKIDLASATRAEVNAAYIKYKATNFPYLVRKHAAYSAEMNALKILDTYMQSALKDIHMSPFLAKLHELIETNLPDPVTGKETWSLKDHKEGLYNELRRWNDFLATGTNAQIPDTPRMIMNTLNKNIAYATLSGLIRSGGIQLSTLVNTQQAIGPLNTFNAVVANLTDHLTGGKRREFALANSEILSSRRFIEAYNEVSSAIIGRRPRDFFHALRTGDFGSIQETVGRPGFKLMELFDMEAAVMSWNGAYKQAKGKMGYTHKDSVRFADDLVVRTQGSTMPGDLSGIQRNALGKLVTQFQTFLISDWNFLTNEVLSKQRTGGGGGGQIPPGGVASGTGDWSKGGKPSTFKLIGNIIQLLAATQLVNELYKMMHIQPAQPDPVEDIKRGRAAGHGPAGLAWDVAVGQTERVPLIGGALRYGTGITGPATETVRELTRAARGDPLVRNPYEDILRHYGQPEPEMVSKLAEPISKMVGVPYTRQVGKTVLGLNRGASVYDSLMGWYEPASGGRERRETRERRSRSERRR